VLVAQDLKVGRYFSHRRSGKPDRRTREVILLGEGEEVDEVVVVAEVEVAEAVAVVMLAVMAQSSATKAISSVSSATSMDTMQIGVLVRRREMENIVGRQRRRNRQCCSQKRWHRDCSSICRMIKFREFF
jgi:hypothetical protein